MPSHSVDAFTKSIYQQVLKTYPELLQVNSGRFRTGKEIQRLLFQLEMVHKLGCPYYVNRRTSLIKRLFFSKSQYSLYVRGIKHLRRKLFKYAPKTFCLNNVQSSEEIKKMQSFLSARFPEKAPWEI